LTRRRLAAFLLAVLGCALFNACAGRLAVSRAEMTPEPQVGVYRGRLVEAEEKNRRFRLLLFVALPDRVHGEVVSPVGSTLMIVDGGAGQLAVTLVRDGVSYVGKARPEILERILGVRLSLEELVRGFLSGMEDADYTDCSVTRSAEELNGLPQAIEFRSHETSLSFELKKVRPLGRPTETLGTGRPPDGTEIRGLDELGAEHLVGEPGEES
jgi:hypothetical protein